MRVFFGFVICLNVLSCGKKGTADGSDTSTADVQARDLNADAIATSPSATIAKAIPTQPGPELSRDELLAIAATQCGLKGTSAAEALTYKKALLAEHIRARTAPDAILAYSGRTTWDFADNILSIQLEAKIDKVDGGLNGEVEPIRQEAEEHLARLRGKVTASIIPFTEREAVLAKVAGWEHMPCGIVAVSRLKTSLGKYVSEISFSPALPLMILPTADSKRLVAEIGQTRLFSAIEAKVLATNDPSLKVGQILKGEVKIEQIASERRLPDGLRLKGDSAYRLTSLWGKGAEQLALGIKPVSEYYLDHGARSLNAAAFDSGAFNLDGLPFFSGR